MESPETSALNRLLNILNTILGFVGQDLDVRNISNPRFNPFTLANVIVGSVYSTYLLTCMVHMRSLETISEIVWIVPLMIQSVVMSINGQAKYGTALEFIRWMMDLMASTHSVAFIQLRVQLANEQCMKMAKRLFCCSMVMFVSCISFYIGEWLCTDKVLMTNVSEMDEQLSPDTYYLNVVVQVINAWFLCNIFNGYNMFLYLGGVVLVFRLKTISATLTDLRGEQRSAEWHRMILMQCHSMHVEVLHWIKRFTGYYDVVALVMLSTFIVTQCFLLYTLQNPLTRNSMSFVVFMAGAFIIFALCLFGELITIEAEEIRRSLCNLNWEEFDVDTRRVVLFMIMASTPDRRVKVGRIFSLNMPNFAKFVKMCFSFCAVLGAV